MPTTAGKFSGKTFMYIRWNIVNLIASEMQIVGRIASLCVLGWCFGKFGLFWVPVCKQNEPSAMVPFRSTYLVYVFRIWHLYSSGATDFVCVDTWNVLVPTGNRFDGVWGKQTRSTICNLCRCTIRYVRRCCVHLRDGRTMLRMKMKNERKSMVFSSVCMHGGRTRLVV